MSLRSQNFDAILSFRIFCKRVKGAYSKKTVFVFDFDEIMKNKKNQENFLICHSSIRTELFYWVIYLCFR